MSSFTTTSAVNFGRGNGYNKGEYSVDDVAVFVNRKGDDDDDDEDEEGRGSGYN